MDPITVIRWGAALCVIAASLMVACGRTARLMAAGFVLFTVASMAWIGAAWWQDEWALLTQNTVLLAINLWGLRRWRRRAAREARPDAPAAPATPAE